MSMVINTNLSSLTAQRHLASSRAEMETAMERLSSGKRINSAGDDAAGLTIANQMNSQITSLNQATRNANDGIAMINLAEGAMDQLTSMLTRMKELATQSANGIYSEDDRTNLNKEFDALNKEIARIASVTTYNGQKVLGEGATSVSYQVGDLATDMISVGFKNTSNTKIGEVAATADVLDTATLTSTVADDVQKHVFELANTAGDVGEVFSVNVGGKTYSIEFSDADGSENPSQSNMETTLSNLAALIQADFDDTQWVVDAKSVHTDGDGVDTAETIGTAVPDGSSVTGTVLVLTGAAGNRLDVTDLNVYEDAGVAIASVSAATIGDATAARSAMASVDQALKDVDTYRSDLGAKSNQLEHTAANLTTRTQFISAAKSRIMDADYAVESANLAKAQVLQQAGTAMLAQANASTQNVLSLLK